MSLTRLRIRHLVSVVAAVLLLACALPQARAVNLMQSVALSKQTGLPMLVIVTSPTCQPCQQLKQQLATDPELQPLLQQFVCVNIDLVESDDEFQLWAQQFPPTGTGIPMIFVVTSTGEQLVNQSGAPQGDGVRQLLSSAIERSGGPRDLSQLASGGDQEEAASPLASAEETAEDDDSPQPVTVASNDDDSDERPRRRPPASSGSSSDPSQDSEIQRERRLDSYLQMAQRFSEDHPEKTREYVQKILDLSPNSSQAQQGRALLESL